MDQSGNSEKIGRAAFGPSRYGERRLKIIVPSKADRELVDRIIYEELCLGVVKEESRKRYLQIMQQLRKEGAEGIIEGCTEIAMLVQQEHTDIALFDTTAIHAEEAVNMAITSTP